MTPYSARIRVLVLAALGGCATPSIDVVAEVDDFALVTVQLQG